MEQILLKKLVVTWLVKKFPVR